MNPYTQSIEGKLIALEGQRPEMPRPFIPDSPAAKAWQQSYQSWIEAKDRLKTALAIRGFKAKAGVI